MTRHRNKRFFKIYCHDCGRYILQGFSEDDIALAGQIHSDIRNHETTMYEEASRHDQES